jgi:hypothetical protein
VEPSPADPIAAGLATIRLRLAVSSLAITLAGCIPFPHCVRTASELSGQLTENGQPLVGVSVKRILTGHTVEQTCEQAGDEAVTDANGRFTFPEHSQFAAGVPTDPHSLPRITLCAKAHDHWLEMLSEWRPTIEPRAWGPAAVPHVQIDCELHPGPHRPEICEPATAPVF